jgi:hypothetical protein
MERPKGLETLKEVDGLIVQRRLHKQEDVDETFFKEPIDENRIRASAVRLGLEIEFIYGELPHFSSTLVRRAPGHWRSFLPSSVIQYLDARPHLLKQLLINLEADVKNEKDRAELLPPSGPAAACVLRGLDAVHALQLERGRTGLHLSTGSCSKELEEMRAQTDAIIDQVIQAGQDGLKDFDEGMTLFLELQQVHVWLQRDRNVMQKRCDALVEKKGVDGWTARLGLVEKFNPRIDVLIGATIRALTEILGSNKNKVDKDLPELLYKWCQGKEALGRVRAFVAAAGPSAKEMVRSSLKMRARLNQFITTKDRRIARVLSLEAGMSARVAAPDALHRMLENVTLSEWSLMSCFASSTPIGHVHKLLANRDIDSIQFDVDQFFDASSSAIDFLLSFAKALTASACASA